jgi:hypothetical protein
VYQFLFYASLLTALLGWICLIAIPNSKMTAWIVETKILHGIICLLYTIAVIRAKGVSENAGFFSVPGVLELFKSADAVVAAWLHIIVFDFFVGTWIFEDARIRSIKRLPVAILLLVTIMLGPLGLLSYLLMRLTKKAAKAA